MDYLDIKHSFNQDGFVKISNFLNEAQSKELQTKLNNFIKIQVHKMPPEHAFYEDPNEKSTLKQLFHLSKYDPFFEQLLNDSEFEKLAEVLLGEKMANRHQHLPAHSTRYQR